MRAAALLLLGIAAAAGAAPPESRQARTLALDRGIRCVTLDYHALRGVDDVDSRLF